MLKLITISGFFRVYTFKYKIENFQAFASTGHLGSLQRSPRPLVVTFICSWIPPPLREKWTPWQFSKQISKLFFQLSVQVNSLLDQTEEERKTFLEGARRGATLWDYSQEYLVVISDEKVSPFVKFEIIPPSFVFYQTPLETSTARHGVLR